MPTSGDDPVPVLLPMAGGTAYGSARMRAAQYVRMSTEHQKYSTENQEHAIRLYAERHGIEIVATFADHGKSGLSLDGREALQRLIREVESGRAAFETILVYDVSRWGRFQDADQAAALEYICRRSGITVHYCAEQFINDGSLGATLIKSVKRVMAGEYSRELSTKVFAGQCRLIRKGFRQGGPAGFGLRRQLIAETGNAKGLLARGEHKSLQTDRVILVPGPANELRIVADIYRMFVDERRGEREIAAILNARGVTTDLGKPWTRGTVHQVISNEKYAGHNVFNRVSFKLKQKRVVNPPDARVRCDGAFEAIVAPPLFAAAQAILAERARRFSDAQMLDALRDLLGATGWLSGLVIDEQDSMPSSDAYRHRFGSLLRAYTLIGYAPGRDYRYLETNRFLRALHGRLVEDVVQEIGAGSGSVRRDPVTDLLTVNDEVSVSLVVCRCVTLGSGAARWKVRLDTSLRPDITLAIRMQANNHDALDYYLLPSIDVGSTALRMAEENGLHLDAYRAETLTPFFKLVERTHIRRAA